MTGRDFFLLKLADILDVPADSKITSHFPFLQQQQSWKYQHHDGKLVLQNGEAKYAFKLPEGFDWNDEDKFSSFPLERITHDEFSKSDAPIRTAQVHRAHPGEVYFTLQEGYRNPTFHFHHEEGNKWKGIIKKKVVKKIKDLLTETSQIPVSTTEEVKTAGIFDKPGTGQSRFHKMLERKGLTMMNGKITKRADFYDMGRGALGLVDSYGKAPLAAVIAGSLAHEAGSNLLQGHGTESLVSPGMSHKIGYGVAGGTALLAALAAKNLFLPTAFAAFN